MPDSLRGHDALDELASAAVCLRGLDAKFLARFSPEQLLHIFRAWLRSENLLPPDQWDPRQVKEAIEHEAPACFDSLGQPLL